jgi:hypothetical protein
MTFEDQAIFLYGKDYPESHHWSILVGRKYIGGTSSWPIFFAYIAYLVVHTPEDHLHDGSSVSVSELTRKRTGALDNLLGKLKDEIKAFV